MWVPLSHPAMLSGWKRQKRQRAPTGLFLLPEDQKVWNIQGPVSKLAPKGRQEQEIPSPPAGAEAV